MIAAVILAAGASSRLGHPKQLVERDGQSLLRHTVACVVEGGCAPVLVVLAPDAPDIARFVAELAGLPVEIVENPRWREGQSASVRAGIAALAARPEIAAALLLVVDQPSLTVAVVRRLCGAFDGATGRIVASAYAGTLGVPAIFERSRFPDLMALAGDRGAKPLFVRHAADVRQVPWPAGALDVD
jgi:molybdenum cofactor cytidylyltransferase